MSQTAQTQQSNTKKFIFGGVSCMSAALVTNPIDVIKTRLQIQGELSKNAVKKYDGFIRGSFHIVTEEGFFGLYKGLSASLLREGTYSTLRMGGYDVIKDFLMDIKFADLSHHQKANANHASDQPPLYIKVTSGLISGAIGSAIANPSDLIKVRMQACNSSNVSRYSSIYGAFKEIIQLEGFWGLYKGVIPTVKRAALLTASQLSSYDHIKHSILNFAYSEEERDMEGWKEPLWAQFSSSVCAGLIAAIVTSPVDTVKTRVMNQPFDLNGKGLFYSGSIDCFSKTFKAEGMAGLYKGFIPNWMRIGPHTIVTMLVYEWLRKHFGISPV